MPSTFPERSNDQRDSRIEGQDSWRNSKSYYLIGDEMNCLECGVIIEEPTNFEVEIEVCMRCIRKRIPKIEPKVEIKRPLSKLKCVYCLGTIYSYRAKKRGEVLTSKAVHGIAGVHHPICKRRFIAELERRGYNVLIETKLKRTKTSRKKKNKKKVDLPNITSAEDMKKWITKQI